MPAVLKLFHFEESRICRKCKIEQPIKEFRNYSYKTGILRSRLTCRTCEYKSTNRRRKLNKDKSRARRNKLKAVEYFGNKCSMCGGTYHPVCYEFHHVDHEQKKHNPSYMLAKADFDKALEELKKCVMLCSNCHKLIHWEYEYGG